MIRAKETTLWRSKFFGYGSLVNLRTMAEVSNAETVRVYSMRRDWSHRATTPFGNVTALTVADDHSAAISGLLIELDRNSGESDFDSREIGYKRETLRQRAVYIPSERQIFEDIFYYRSMSQAPANYEFPILRSYIDCVLEGYLSVFGEEGVANFVATTTGWNGYILEDRAEPIYPRAIGLPTQHYLLFDEILPLCARSRY